MWAVNRFFAVTARVEVEDGHPSQVIPMVSFPAPYTSPMACPRHLHSGQAGDRLQLEAVAKVPRRDFALRVTSGVQHGSVLLSLFFWYPHRHSVTSNAP